VRLRYLLRGVCECRSFIGFEMKRIALTSGGDVPGMNAAIRAVTRRALFMARRCSGSDVVTGLVKQDFMPLGPRDGAGFCISAGALGSARCGEFRRKPAWSVRLSR
jgi:6-phosphofructokinase 1